MAGTAWIQLVDGAALTLVEPVDSAALPMVVKGVAHLKKMMVLSGFNW